MEEPITLDLGFKTYEVRDPEGNLAGTVRFNPADPGFAGRWQQAEARIREYRDKIDGLAAAGAPEIDQWPVLMEASDAIQQALDYAFAAPVSRVFFGGNSAFAMTGNGRTVLENVLEGVTPIIGAALQQAAAKAQARLEQHTAPYDGTAKGLAPGQSPTG